MALNESEITRLIDHTLLKPDATQNEISKLCEEALQYHFASVCVNPWYVAQVVEILRGSAVKACTVAGFPLGANLPCVKVFEAQKSIERGAQEIDMVINIGALKSGHPDMVESEIREVAATCHQGGAICKVILETCLLTHDEKIQAALAAKNAGADFVKTSTGFSTAGATPEDVRLIRETIGPHTGIKAAGGIRTLEDLQKMVAAGATRIGASAGVKIIEQLRSVKSSAAAGRASGDKY
jgi:deoxyribose-phosphate aldolase